MPKEDAGHSWVYWNTLHKFAQTEVRNDVMCWGSWG